MPTISVIIPTLNEAENIGKLVSFLKQNNGPSLLEIIVVDAFESSDGTENIAAQAGAKVVKSAKSRAKQMNLGAQTAKGEILYFIHADCLPPKSYITDIQHFIKEYPIGCYRYRFDSSKLMLQINSFFTRFPPLWCRGGDETLFVERRVFENLKGFNEHFCIMEEYDFIRRARAEYRFKIIPKNALVSARKYEKNSWLRVQIANFTAMRMFMRGEEPLLIAAQYKEKLWRNG
jgi:rSAM/selenodomain-associated transferase 2